MDPSIVGIVGAMGAGKDSLAAAICRLEPAFCVRKFADALREAVSTVADVPAAVSATAEGKALDLSQVERPCAELRLRLVLAAAQATGQEPPAGVVDRMCEALVGERCLGSGAVAIPMTVGRLLQVLGTECFRDLLGADVWIDAFVRRWEADGRPPAVVSDVRFPNEAAAIRALGGVVVRVQRAAAGRSDGRDAGHSSERGADAIDADFVVSNDGSLADLGAAAAHILRCVGRRPTPAERRARPLLAGPADE